MSLVATPPEKTLEHWTSSYLRYRYKSKVSLWWPSFGQDIELASPRNLPGKSLNLEIKTSYMDSRFFKIKIRYSQLISYISWNSPSFEPYYVFPLPIWPGRIEDYARVNLKNKSEFSYSRSGSMWYPNWAWVIHSRSLYNYLQKNQSLISQKDDEKTLVKGTWNSTKNKYDLQWLPSRGPRNRPTFQPPSSLVNLRDFLDKFEQCGGVGFPQAVHLPRFSLLEGVSIEGVKEQMIKYGIILQNNDGYPYANNENVDYIEDCDTFIIGEKNKFFPCPTEGVSLEVPPGSNLQRLFVDARAFVS
ncbi:hypothetical protein ACN082_04005 [Rothia sp. CCM 9417]|uniref:hypothetical protein n=1 Tax=Rothia sp. CCM 9417 TaxID=3402657 RepID=UPI003AE1F590